MDSMRNGPWPPSHQAIAASTTHVWPPSVPLLAVELLIAHHRASAVGCGGVVPAFPPPNRAQTDRERVPSRRSAAAAPPLTWLLSVQGTACPGDEAGQASMSRARCMRCRALGCCEGVLASAVPGPLPSGITRVRSPTPDRDASALVWLSEASAEARLPTFRQVPRSRHEPG
jgi:hypothetical protein